MVVHNRSYWIRQRNSWPSLQDTFPGRKSISHSQGGSHSLGSAPKGVDLQRNCISRSAGNYLFLRCGLAHQKLSSGPTIAPWGHRQLQGLRTVTCLTAHALWWGHSAKLIDFLTRIGSRHNKPFCWPGGKPALTAVLLPPSQSRLVNFIIGYFMILYFNVNHWFYVRACTIFWTKNL